WFISLAGQRATALTAATVGVCLVPVLILAYVLYRIEKRPIVLGMYYLALSAVLVLVPPTPYAGALLPLNMAMLATRNLEYGLYLISLCFLLTTSRWKSWRTLIAVSILGLLMASDKLFLIMSLGGAVIALLVYVLAKRRSIIRIYKRWLFATLAALALSWLILSFINRIGLTHIAAQTSGSPYNVSFHLKDLALGIIFGGLGILTNFGANPVFDQTILRTLPSAVRGYLLNPLVLAYVANFVLMVFGVYAGIRVGLASLFQPKNKKLDLNVPAKLTITLCASTLAAGAGFVMTKHAYEVDARYLSIILFTLFVAIATYFRNRNFLPHRGLVLVSGVLALSLMLGWVAALRIYDQDRTALDTIVDRNQTVAATLALHPVDTVVGDYWRVLPLKAQSGGKMNVIPLENCTTNRQALSSGNWQLDLNTHSFAYLLTFDKSLTDFPLCNLEEVVNTYGRPNASSLIAGTLDHPGEMLLFYDHGINKSSPSSPGSTSPTTTILPIRPEELPQAMCENVPTTVNVVAHEDDDLLFMSPDLLHAVQDGECVRTIYLTSGDAGYGRLYWLSREHGSEAAYSKMLKQDNLWIQRTIKLADHQFVTVVNPRGNQKIMLVFMHLPDGNLWGQGFPQEKNESLQHLESGSLPIIHSVDGQSSYSSTDLDQALAALFRTFGPTEIHTQLPENASVEYPDHSDHIAAGGYAERAHNLDDPSIPIHYYVGYPVHTREANVAGDDLALKIAAFDAYNDFDAGVCQSVNQCLNGNNYGLYLMRQYSQ
ncbi:MAG TPA: PIG-L family deacetylase, partial [Patescibacteria group bacterium]|nr:PIG-L family deacetylase [Patescibacteria group bacterium]